MSESRLVMCEQALRLGLVTPTDENLGIIFFDMQLNNSICKFANLELINA